MSTKIYWPESQSCVGCKHGCFLMNETESSVYICSQGLSSPEEFCHEPDVSHLDDLDDDFLFEKEYIFAQREKHGLPINLGDFAELQIELERRCNQ